MIRRSVIVVSALVAVALAAGYFGYARTAIPSGVGLAAKHLCSLVYVSELDRNLARRGSESRTSLVRARFILMR